MKKIETVEWSSKYPTTITVVEETVIRCSIAGDLVPVVLKISYSPENKIVELVSLRKFINHLAEKHDTVIEEFAVSVLEAFREDVEPSWVVVEVQGKSNSHGLVHVKVSSSGAVMHE